MPAGLDIRNHLFRHLLILHIRRRHYSVGNFWKLLFTAEFRCSSEKEWNSYEERWNLFHHLFTSHSWKYGTRKFVRERRVTHGMGYELLFNQNAPISHGNINEIHDFFIRKLVSVRDGGVRQALAPGCPKICKSFSPELSKSVRNI